MMMGKQPCVMRFNMATRAIAELLVEHGADIDAVEGGDAMNTPA